MYTCSVQPLYRYTGHSTDIKPTDGVKDASTFFEEDTRDLYEWRYNRWVLMSEPQYQLSNYDGDDPLYIGSVARGGQWKIEMFSSSGQTMQSRIGLINYTTNWANRASLFT